MATFKGHNPKLLIRNLDGNWIDIMDSSPLTLPLPSWQSSQHTTNEEINENDWEPVTVETLDILASRFRQQEYDDGLIIGYIDGCILEQRDEHPFSETYDNIARRYLSSIWNLNPSPFQIGYGRGFDLAIIHTRHGQ